MGYWTEEDLPFTYSLANTFPMADRWFAQSSVKPIQIGAT